MSRFSVTQTPIKTLFIFVLYTKQLDSKHAFLLKTVRSILCPSESVEITPYLSFRILAEV